MAASPEGAVIYRIGGVGSSGAWTDLVEHLTERAAILEHDSGLDRTDADVVAVRIVQCANCRHWTPDSWLERLLLQRWD
ncbi:MAG: hypothetical protein IPI06_12220 [Gammaproteobacteria bacterium]|nr:hypothetical protein [Gammaproteobacteria bacterium]